MTESENKEMEPGSETENPIADEIELIKSMTDEEILNYLSEDNDLTDDCSSDSSLLEIDNIPSIGQLSKKKGLPYIVSDRAKTTNSIGKILIWSFVIIQFILAVKALFLAPSIDDLVTYVNSTKDLWGTILGFVLGYYFANKE